ncbi:MAG: T9SS type A sorting domain-containing protein [Sphingobacteriaceae bacterium]|jgi:hypothetical protein
MKINLLIGLIMAFTFQLNAQIPLLNSNPNAIHKVIYLDFDGETVIGTAWNSSVNVPTITALPSTLSSAVIRNIWQRMSEDYRPFDVNVTTDVAKFNAASPILRMRIVFTPSSAWYPANVGGVAFLNSFSWGGNPDTPCWVFENKLGYSGKNCAEAGSHEAGHTLSLKHQSVWSTLCAKTAEYHSGVGAGVTSWAPIMGVGYSKNVTIWHNGANSNTCTTFQFDHGSNGITGSLFLNYLADDVGDVYSTAKALNTNTTVLLDSGIITTPSDKDVYKFSICNNRYMTFNIKPWALDTVNYDAANLDIRFQLFDATTTNSLAIDTPLAKLNTLVGMNLNAGSYYFVIDGGGSANYSDYGSLGKYYVRITSNNIPNIISAFNTPNVLCSGQSATLTDLSTGGATAWSWTMTNASPATSTVSNPVITYPFAGIFTISLAATNGTNSSCATSQTVMVNPTMMVGINCPYPNICSGKSTTLSAFGGNTYLWNTINTSSLIVVSPTLNTVYTVTGTTSGCSNSSSISISVNPNPTVNAVSSTSLICTGEAAILTASGANSYTWSTGPVSNSITVSPTITTVYTVTGSDANGCSNTNTVNLIVSWCTGINENNSHANISVYPNPNQGSFTIKTNSNEVKDLIIVDHLGRTIKQMSIIDRETKIDLTKESNGIYYLLLLQNGQQIYSKKLIKN